MAVLVIDYGPDHDLWWTVILTKGEHAGEIWTYPNPDVRGVENITLGRHPAGSSTTERAESANSATNGRGFTNFPEQPNGSGNGHSHGVSPRGPHRETNSRQVSNQ